MYHLFFRLVFRRMDAEKAHHLAFRGIRAAARVPGLRTVVAAVLARPQASLQTVAFGRRMRGPFGAGTRSDGHL